MHNLKYLSIFKFIFHYTKAICGKLTGYIITPLVFTYRDWIRNYSWNYMLANGIEIDRSTVWAEDVEKYHTAKGFILKRSTNKYVGPVVLFLWRYLDDDSDLTSCSRMFVKAEDVKGLVHVGSYFDIGDKARENRINIWTDWKTFKDFYYWMVIRNGFYNYNYYDEDSKLNKCGEFNLPKHSRMHKGGPNPKEFNEHEFFQDSNGRWFFRSATCKHFKGYAYGYEIGWYRKEEGGVNAKVRLYWKKSII